MGRGAPHKTGILRSGGRISPIDFFLLFIVTSFSLKELIRILHLPGAMRKISSYIIVIQILFAHLCFADGSKRDMRSFKIICETKKVKPGDKVSIALEIRRKNGRTYFAQSSDAQSTKLKEKQNWGDFEIQVRGGTLERGTLTISRDVRTYSEGKNVEVVITHRVLKKQSHKLVLQVDFSGDHEINFGGATAGATGKKGNAGIRLFLAEGVDGHPGEDGKNGEHADDIILYIKQDTAYKNDTMLRVLVKFPKKDTSIVFLHNIQKYKLKISANGTNGGDGGAGGRGSGGRDARDATNVFLSKAAGNGGNGGKGGDAGDGGNAGTITVYIENKIQHHLYNKIGIENKPGKAGKPGKGGRGGSGGYGSLTQVAGKSGNDGKDGEAGKDGENAPPPLIYNVEKIDVIY